MKSGFPEALLPKRFFVTTGRGLSNHSPLNAFDAALVDAGIQQCNLVPVSSILPRDAEEIEFYKFPPGAITFCVMAKHVGRAGEIIGAGVCWGMGVDSEGNRYGLIVEAHGHLDNESLETELRMKLKEMARIRRMRLYASGVKVDSMVVPRGKYGCVVAALVFAP